MWRYICTSKYSFLPTCQSGTQLNNTRSSDHIVSYLVVIDVDGLHDLQATRRVLRRPVPGLGRLHDDRGEGPSGIPAVEGASEVLHQGHQLRLVPGNRVTVTLGLQGEGYNSVR